eukprot:jgi/Ulvmu1/2737/UM014_0194.1
MGILTMHGLQAFNALTHSHCSKLGQQGHTLPQRRCSSAFSSKLRSRSHAAAARPQTARWQSANCHTSADRNVTKTQISIDEMHSSPIHAINDTAPDPYAWVCIPAHTAQLPCQGVPDPAVPVARQTVDQEDSFATSECSPECHVNHVKNWQVDAPDDGASGKHLSVPMNDSDALARDGHAGSLCLQALLNLSRMEAAKPQLGRYGLFTLLNVAKVFGQGPRGTLACNILRNIQWHWKNVTLFYQAELRMKYRLLCDTARVWHYCRCSIDNMHRPHRSS